MVFTENEKFYKGLSLILYNDLVTEMADASEIQIPNIGKNIKAALEYGNIPIVEFLSSLGPKHRMEILQSTSPEERADLFRMSSLAERAEIIRKLSPAEKEEFKRLLDGS